MIPILIYTMILLILSLVKCDFNTLKFEKSIVSVARHIGFVEYFSDNKMFFAYID